MSNSAFRTPPLDGRALRTVLATFATGVTVVTVAEPAPRGMTANSFTSVSLDPPLVLVCVERDTAMHASLITAGTFAVSVLAAHQEHLARHFANSCRAPGIAQFDPVEWHRGIHTAAPLIRGALAWFECTPYHRYQAGDHSIILGRVLAATPGNADTTHPPQALLFYRGHYRHLPTQPT